MKKLLLLLSAVSLTYSQIEVHLTNHWSGGFQGRPCFQFTEDVHSWEVTFHFSQPIDTFETWEGTISDNSADKTEYTVVNKEFNGEKHAGDELCIDFIGHVGNQDVNPTVTATIAGATSGSSGGAVTSAPGQTTAPRQTGPTSGQTTAPRQTRPTAGLPSNINTAGGIPGTFTVANDWGGRFDAALHFNIDEPIEGWMLNITYSCPVSKMDIQYGDAVYTSPDGRNWVIVNKRDHVFLKPGVENIQFFGNYEGECTPSANAVLTNLGNDNGWTVEPRPKRKSSKYNYDDVLHKSILFYDAQRSGKLPADNPISWRDDSALGDKGASGEDLTGGWYDAGDHVKFNFPMAFSSVELLWGYLRFKNCYQASGQENFFLDMVKWPLDYLLKCHVADDVLYVQVGDGAQDHSYWGRPEDMTMPRPAFKIDASHPGSDVSMETAAAFAAGYLAFKDSDPTYAATLLQHAKTLWEFAVKHQGKYSDSVSAANGYYPSNNFTDENCWGSMWLYEATKDDKYLDEAKKWFDPTPDWGMSWDDKFLGCQILLYEATGEDIYKQSVLGTFQSWLPGGDISYTPKGLAWRLQWAPLRYASNMAAAALIAAEDGILPEEYRHWAMCQIHYSLGDAGRSYVVGFGENYPTHEHHRGASCPRAPAPCGPQVMSSDSPNVHVLYGALVGGPDLTDGYTDQRSNYVMNEVATDYNAGFQTAVAGLCHLLETEEHPEQTGDATCPYHA